MEYKRIIKEGGLTHVHTEMSKDAILNLDEIGRYIKKNLRSKYFVINDHLTSPYKEKKYSKSEAKKRVERMLNKVDRYNEKHNSPKCISGVEANIITGGVDIPDTLLSKIDVVIASRHFPWGNEGVNRISKNLISAMKNQNVDIIGHINNYVKKSIDWDLIFQVAEKTNTFIEINLNIPPSEKIIQIMSKYNILYTLGVDFHTFQGVKNRSPLNSEVVVDFAEAKQLAKSKTNRGEELKKEYINEPLGFDVLKNLIKLMEKLEDNGIDMNRIVNTLSLDKFSELFKKPKNERIL